MSDHQPEIAELRDRIALTIYKRGGYCGDCEYDGWDSCEDCRRCVLDYADAVLADLGLEQFGWLTRWGDGSESVVPLTRWKAAQEGKPGQPEVVAMFTLVSHIGRRAEPDGT